MESNQTLICFLSDSEWIYMYIGETLPEKLIYIYVRVASKRFQMNKCNIKKTTL